MLLYNTTKEITAFSTTRDGGVAIDGIRALVAPQHQVHGIKTIVADEQFLSMNPIEQQLMSFGYDAVCTNIKGVCVCIKTADCIPVLVYDTISHAVAAIHAGWRGTVQRIVEHTMSLLTSTYGTRPEDCHAIIGPGISLDSFEIGDEVYDEFKKNGFDMGRIAKRYPCTANGQNGSNDTTKWHIDLWEANKLQLQHIGVKTENIQVAGIDTFTNSDRFFSARKNGLQAGRIFNGIMLR